MPVAVGIAQNERFELKSLPASDTEEGGFVVVRRMTYGEKMHRQSLMSGVKFRGDNKKEFEGELQMANRRVTEYEFAVCVIEHNLTDQSERLLNLKSSSDLALLDGQVGEEIGQLLNRVNLFEDEDEELGNSSTGSETTS
jgi:hypothetical protein